MPLMRRLAGVALLLVAYLPLHRLLDVGRAGPAGGSARVAAETAWVLGLSGTVIVLTFAWLLARMIPYDPARPDPVASLADLVARPRSLHFAAAVGIVAFLETAIVSRFVHGGLPTSVDEMAQLLHAAAISSGRLAVPLEGSAAAWVAQNGIVTDVGWVSIYPPMHTLLLAAGLSFGAVWLVGPLLTGLATACFTWAADDLLGARTGRLAGLLLTLSPFWLLLGATPANHVAAAFGLCAVLACAVKAHRGGMGWVVATGAAVGFSVCARPWIGLVGSAALLAALWWPEPDPGRPSTLRRVTGVVAGGAPFAVLLLAWNTTLFGSAMRLGYTVAFGPAHGLGFHVDPWGNAYGMVEAVGYTGADLLLLGVRLLEGPLPALGVIGLGLLVAPLGRGIKVFAAWAAASVAAGFLYWHHGVHFGPRMLYETVPGWMAVLAAAAAALLRPASHPPSGTTARFFRWSVLITLIGGVALAPTALRSAASGRGSPLPAPPAEPAVIFVHGSWSSRVAARLAADGMRRDSIETALRRNGICAVDRYARWRLGGQTGTTPRLDLVPRPGTPGTLAMRELSPGNRVRVDPARAFDAGCVREATADRMGTLELEYFAWRLPPLEGRSVVAARDLGPPGNLPVLEALDLPAYVLVDGTPPVLLGYAEGMELLWGGAAGASVSSRGERR